MPTQTCRFWQVLFLLCLFAQSGMAHDCRDSRCVPFTVKRRHWIIPRIDEAAIVRETEGTFLGDGRVRRQIAVSRIWPRGDVPANYGAPVCVATPTLVVSGTHDPVTPPRWGEATVQHLPNSLHLVVPAVHGSFGPVVDGIHREFLKTRTVENLDTSAVRNMRMPKMSVSARH